GPGVSRQTLCGYFVPSVGQAVPRLTAWLASLALSFNAHCSLNVLQNLAIGAGAVGSLQLTYISKVSIATPKQKPKTPFCFVINALSQRYFLQASDQKDLQDWVEALNRASKITVPKGGSVPPAAEITKPPMVAQAQERKPQMAYKTEIIGGVVVHTPISINQNGGDGGEGSDVATHLLLRRSQNPDPPQGRVGNTPTIFFPKMPYLCLIQKCCSVESGSPPVGECTVLPRSLSRDKGEASAREPRSRPSCVHVCLRDRLCPRRGLQEAKSHWGRGVLQADSPEDMRSWIRAITGAVQALKFRPREMSFMRSTSMVKPGGSSAPSQQRQAVEERRALCKAPSSSSSSWQPWTPVPQAEGRQPVPEEGPREPGRAAGGSRRREDPQVRCRFCTASIWHQNPARVVKSF
uniref:Pleckstrin homology domain containing A2 n=1 Tax=Bubo bubo TaxID=30461 RepID=A0A8C0EYK5_BUBBB